MATEKRIEKRTVLVVGKAGAGKTTVCNKLLGYDGFKYPDGTLENDIFEIQQAEVKITEESTNKEYHIRIIDTIGFFGQHLTNEEILTKLKDFLEKGEVKGINLVIVVYRKGRLTQEEGKALEYFTYNFKGTVSNISALVMTNCEGVNDEGRQSLIKEFKYNESTKSIAKFMERGIYTVGFPDTSKMKQSLKAAFEEDINTDRNTLLDVVKSATEEHLREEIVKETFWNLLYKSCIIL